MDNNNDEKIPWTNEDWRLPEDELINAAHPMVGNGSHKIYEEALRMVSAKRSKSALVALVNWLLYRIGELKVDMRSEVLFKEQTLESLRVRDDLIASLREKNKKIEDRLIGARTLYKSTVKAHESALDDADHFRKIADSNKEFAGAAEKETSAEIMHSHCFSSEHEDTSKALKFVDECRSERSKLVTEKWNKERETDA